MIVPDVVHDIWKNDPILQATVPIDEDERRNQFYLYGVDHIPDAQLLGMRGNYAILRDLGDDTLVNVPRISVWPHRLSVYTSAALDSWKTLEHFMELAKEFGGVCNWNWNSRQLVQTEHHFVARVNLRPVIAEQAYFQ